MRPLEPIPAGIDENNEIIPLGPIDTATDSSRFQLFIAAVNENAELVYTNQTTLNGPFQKSWTRIGTDDFMGVVASGTTLDGRVAIIAVEKSTLEVHYVAEAPQNADGKDRWLPAENLGRPKGVPSFAELQLIRGVDGLDNVFGASTADNKTSLWWTYRNPPKIVTKTIEVTPPGSDTPMTITVQETAPPDTPWSNWININGALVGTFHKMKAANNADGRIVLTGVDTNGRPWVSQQKSDDPFQKESWTDWCMPGGEAAPAASAITPALGADGYVSVFTSTNDGLLRSRQAKPGGALWGPLSAPGQIQDNVSTHAVSIDADGQFYVAVLNFTPPGETNTIYGVQEVGTLDARWTSWQRISSFSDPDGLRLHYNADGTLLLFSINKKTRTLWSMQQVAKNSTEWYYFWTDLGGQLIDFSVTQDLTPS
jgi:hypothetical protein